MARPSLKKERTEEILLAFEHCVAMYGVEGATLEKLAEESKLQRSLIRHFVGNRDDLIKSLLTRYIDKSEQQTQLLLQHLPKKDAAAAMVKYLFDDDYTDKNFALIASALFSAAANIDYLKQPLKDSVNHFIHAIDELLSQTHPNSSKENRYAVATGIVGIYFNIESLTHLNDIEQLRTASKHSAQLLLQSLSTT